MQFFFLRVARPRVGWLVQKRFRVLMRGMVVLPLWHGTTTDCGLAYREDPALIEDHVHHFQPDWVSEVHSLRLTWKLPEGLSKWDQVFQKGPGRHVSLGSCDALNLNPPEQSDWTLDLVWTELGFAN